MKNSDVAYNQIKELIITGELKPGQPIVDSELAKRFDMGRNSVREALSKLEWEGQVKVISRQCITVSELNLDDLDSIVQIRYVLSELEGKLAASRRTQQDIDYINKLIDVIKTERSPDKRVFLDRNFHRAISKLTKDKFLEEQMNKTLDLCVRLLFLNRDSVESVDNAAVREYENILDAIIKKDEEKTVELLRNHVTVFKNKFLK